MGTNCTDIGYEHWLDNMNLSDNTYNNVVGKPDGKRQHGRPKHRWK
jgi:glycyl-tRNA synthetase alpha subunit